MASWAQTSVAKCSKQLRQPYSKQTYLFERRDKESLNFPLTDDQYKFLLLVKSAPTAASLRNSPSAVICSKLAAFHILVRVLSLTSKAATSAALNQGLFRIQDKARQGKVYSYSALNTQKEFKVLYRKDEKSEQETR